MNFTEAVQALNAGAPALKSLTSGKVYIRNSFNENEISEQEKNGFWIVPIPRASSGRLRKTAEYFNFYYGKGDVE
jgi:hypothetical protein